MAPDALLKSTEFQNKMFKTLNSANNIDFGQAFIEQPQAGSIDLNVHTTKMQNFDNLKIFLESIKNKNINKEMLSTGTSEAELFKKVIKQMLELKKFDNLEEFTFKLNQEEIKFSEYSLEYLFKESKNLYGEQIDCQNATISHSYILKDGRSSLVINTDKYGVINCHFEYNLDKVKKFNNNIGKNIEVHGTKTSEQTIDLKNFEIQS
jgi:hypothetical protein